MTVIIQQQIELILFFYNEDKKKSWDRQVCKLSSHGLMNCFRRTSENYFIYKKKNISQNKII